MTPHTTVVPFEFYICDCSGVLLTTLGERFVICDEEENPSDESLFENMEIYLDARQIPIIHENIYKCTDYYVTHIVMFNMRPCYAAARSRAWRAAVGSVTPGSGSG